MKQLDALTKDEIVQLITQLNKESQKLIEREQQLEDQAEELSSQKEELTAAIEALMSKNTSLEHTLSQLRDRSFELDQILYRTSHDLRSPISSIKGILALLEIEPQSDIIRSYGKHIEDKVIQMDNLLRSLTSLSKSILEEPQFDIVDLNKLIWLVVSEYRHLPGWAQVHVSVESGELKPYTDPALITIIFQSLISNAFIFRDPTKKGTMLVRVLEKTGHYFIDVIDDGEGVDAAVQASIFDMFYRGSERSIGNGLGLYVAKKAASRLKGSISLYVETNTRFTVTLPLQTTPENASI